MGNFPSRRLNHGTGNYEGHPDPGLVGRAFRPTWIKGCVDNRKITAVVANDDHQSVGGFRPVLQISCVVSGGQSSLNQYPTDLMVNPLLHLLHKNPLVSPGGGNLDVKTRTFFAWVPDNSAGKCPRI